MRPADIEYSQRITERSPNNIYIHILNNMADIFKQVYVEKIYLTFRLKPIMRKLEKDNGLNMSRDICIIFSQKIDKQLLVLFEYLTVFLDKISNKKNYFENDESF